MTFQALKTPSDQLDTNTESQNRAFRKGRGAVAGTSEETRAPGQGHQGAVGSKMRSRGTAGFRNLEFPAQQVEEEA